ncbi:MAG: hypothetical protein ACLUSP_09025 [Christensenellales bacterium]
MSLITDGKWSEENLELCRADKEEIEIALEENGVQDASDVCISTCARTAFATSRPKTAGVLRLTPRWTAGGGN